MKMAELRKYMCIVTVLVAEQIINPVRDGEQLVVIRFVVWSG